RRGALRRLLHQVPLANRPLHLLRLLAIPAAVLEPDRGVLVLARTFGDDGALSRDALVLDPHVHECLLDAPARVAFDPHPLSAAAVELHCHPSPPPLSPRRRSYDTGVRAVFEIRPPAWGETLAILQSVSLPDGPEKVRARVVEVEGERVTIDFPA